MSTLNTNVTFISGVMTQRYPLQTKLVRYILLAMTCCGLLFGVLTLTIQYLMLVSDIKIKSNQSATAQLPSLALNLFSYNEEGVELILNALQEQEIIQTAKLLSVNEDAPSSQYVYPISYDGPLGNEKLGSLLIEPNLDFAVRELKQSATTLILSLFLMIICLGLFSVWLFRYLVMNHLMYLVEQISNSKPGDIELFKFKREQPKIPDELQHVIDSFNELHLELNCSIKEKESANFSLHTYKESLELKVKERTKELEEVNDVVIKASQAKSDFMSNMSHEIRTPANGIVGLTELLLRMDLKSEQKEYVSKIKLSTKSLLRVINEILDYGKIESGEAKIEILEFEMSDLILESANIFSQECKEKGLYLHIEINYYSDFKIKSDPTRINQIINNFLSNAIKFTSSGGINIKVEAQSDGVFINVIDTGMGISSTTLTKLFNPFVQADSTITRQFGGTGLGLTICKKYIELMGAKIHVKSEEGKGSEFGFILPYSDELTPSQLPDLSCFQNKSLALLSKNASLVNHVQVLCNNIGVNLKSYEQAECINYDLHFTLLIDEDEFEDDFSCPINYSCIVDRGTKWSRFNLPMTNAMFYDNLKMLMANEKNDEELNTQEIIHHYPSKRILLVEDNFLNQEVARALLEQSSIEVESAYDGKEGIELAKSDSNFDLILMDIQMPVMDGLEAIKHINNDEILKRIPVIAFTALSSEDEINKFKDAGFTGHLPKPFESDQLYNVLDQFLIK